MEISLAMAELFAMLGNVFRRFSEIELFETTLEDVDMDMAMVLFPPYAKADSKGLRVRVK